jgi:hypothetical protein
MIPDNEFSIARVLGQIKDLRQSLMGYGTPPVTPRAQVDGKRVAVELRALQVTIDEFLTGKY